MAPSECAADARSLLFVGNPGAGKSTLLNSLVPQLNSLTGLEEPLFKSGVSLGHGLTFKMDQYVGDDGITYMDTPGLSDMKMRKQAAESIGQALNSGGWFQLVFVVTLEAGRFKPDDLTTMRLVLEASKDIHGYGLIINKVPKGTKRKLEDPVAWRSFLETVPSFHRSRHIFVNERDDELEDTDNVVTLASKELRLFIEQVPKVAIEESMAQHIEYKKMKDIAAESQKQVLDLKNQIAQQEQQFKDLVGQAKSDAAQMVAKLQKEKQWLQAEMERIHRARL